MDITKKLTELRLGSTDSSTTDMEILSFVEFFKEGTVGRRVFVECIVPFLSLDDLVNGSVTCRQMNAMCHTYTLGEILSLHSMEDVSREHKLELGKLIIGFTSGKYKSCDQLHRRLVHSSTDGSSFWARLYHPCAMHEILFAMTAYFETHGIPFDAGMDEFDWDANSDPSIPVLVSAEYGHRLHGTTDVTMILRYLLMSRGNNKGLTLEPPPRGPRYWYNYLFGDPCPKVTKTLWIKMRLRRGKIKVSSFLEDRRVHEKLRAAANPVVDVVMKKKNQYLGGTKGPR